MILLNVALISILADSQVLQIVNVVAVALTACGVVIAVMKYRHDRQDTVNLDWAHRIELAQTAQTETNDLVRADNESLRAQLTEVRADLRDTREELRKTEDDLAQSQRDLRTAQAEIRSLQRQIDLMGGPPK